MIIDGLNSMQAISVSVTLADVAIIVALFVPFLVLLVTRRTRRKRTKWNGASWTHLREIVRQRDNERCYYCGIVAKDGHVDHMVPKSRGGSNGLSNLVWACASCNLSKGRLTAEEFATKTANQTDMPEIAVGDEWAQVGRLLAASVVDNRELSSRLVKDVLSVGSTDRARRLRDQAAAVLSGLHDGGANIVSKERITDTVQLQLPDTNGDSHALA